MGGANLQTVNRQTSARLRGTVLQLRDDRVMHVFLLLPEGLRTNRVDRVATQLVLALHVLQDINLEPAI